MRSKRGHENILDMTTTAESPYQPPPPPWTRPRLERSRNDRYVSGVCGGLGRYFDIDPVVFRVVLVCMAIFGAGFFVYAVGWAFIPSEGHEFSVAQAARRHGTPGREFLVIGVVVLAGFAAVDATFGWRDSSQSDWVVFALALAGFLWWRRERGMRGELPQPPMWPTAPAPPVGGPPADPPAPSAFWAATATTPMSAPAAAAAPESSRQWGYRPPPERPARERSHLGTFTFSALMLGVGLLLVLAALGWVGPSAQAILAIALVIVGGGLLIGAWYGRSRGLIALGLLLTIAVATVSVLDVPFRGGTGDVTWRVTSVEQLAGGFHLRAGSAILDLSALDLGPVARSVEVSVAAGDLTISVPAGVGVRIRGKVGMGTASVFGRVQDGVGLKIDSSESGQPQLTINVRIGFGELQVHHEAS